MTALARHLAEPFDVRKGAKVELVEPADEGWHVITEAGESLRASTLLLTPSAPQSIALLAACAD
ncbi:MAG: hypothetical protein ACLPX8_02155 [Bryobacteraceae bacterium]|jgi:predicted NAD/FAD-dependent oxidoreductase